MSAGRKTSDDWLWSYVDILLLSFFALCSYALLAMASINPPAKDNPNVTPPGAIAVSIAWPAGNTDCDLWVKSPDDALAVGYGRKSGTTWSLLRDDLGMENDASPINMENAFARSLPAGEWAINVHGYSLRTGPLTVHVEVSINGVLLVKTDMLLKPKQERTVIRFTLDSAGRVANTNTVFVPLRSEKK